MKIYRDGQAIELTEQEVCDIYLEAKEEITEMRFF